MTRFARAFVKGFGKPIDMLGRTTTFRRGEAARLALMTGLPIATVELYLDWRNVGDDIRHAMKDWKEQYSNVQAQSDRSAAQA